MTFHEVALKSFKANAKRYLSIFLCCSLCVTVLNVLLNILNNKAFEPLLIDTNIKILLRLSVILVVIFMIFFISYAIQTFLKSRSREFGLYLILGMLRKDFTKLVLIETGIIGAFSLIGGLLAGTALTYFLFMLSRIIAELKSTIVAFNGTSLIETTVLFILLFFIQLYIVWVNSKKLQFIELMKQGRRPENIDMPGVKSSLGLSIAAITALLFTYVSFYHMISDSSNKPVNNFTPVLYIVISLISIYILISRAGTLLIHLYKKSKRKYYNNLLGITEICFKINQNKKIIFVSTILFVVVIFFISAAYSILGDVPEITELEQPYHIGYADFNKSMDAEKVDELIKANKAKLVKHQTIDFLYANRIIHVGISNISSETAVISDEQYSKISGSNIKLERNEVLQLNADVGGSANSKFPFKRLTLKFGDQLLDFKFAGEIKSIFINLKVQPSRFMIIMNNDDFYKVMHEIDKKHIGMFHLMNFEDWEKTGPLVNELKRLNKSDLFSVASRIEYYVFKRQTAIMRIFIAGFMGLLFLVCIGCVMYFKQITDMERLKDKYRKLRKIGITNSEFKKMNSRELRMIFMMPFFLGAALGIAIMYITTLNSRMERLFLINSIIVVLVFFLFQLIYYILTLRKYNGISECG